jgi:hypothetical protein
VQFYGFGNGLFQPEGEEPDELPNWHGVEHLRQYSFYDYEKRKSEDYISVGAKGERKDQE